LLLLLLLMLFALLSYGIKGANLIGLPVIKGVLLARFLPNFHH
jgi:hypothetical protein